MIVGMYINDKDISVAGLTSESNTAVIIKDSSVNDEQANNTPLKVYVNDGMAYVGKMAEPILQAVPKLEVAYHFLSNTKVNDDLLQPAKLLAICLKKIHHDIKIFDDSSIENILVCVPVQYSDKQKQIIQIAFELANLPYAGCIATTKAIVSAYDINETSHQSLIVTWHPDNIQLNLIDENKSINLNKNLTIVGEETFKQEVLKLIVKQYEKATGCDLEILNKNKAQLLKITNKVIQQFSKSQCNLSTFTCYLNEVAVELCTTKKIFDQAIEPVVELLITTIKTFLKEADIEITDLNCLALAGQSYFFNRIISKLEQYVDNEKIYSEHASEVLAKGATYYLDKMQNSNENLFTTNINISIDQIEAEKELIRTTLINAGCNT